MIWVALSCAPVGGLWSALVCPKVFTGHPHPPTTDSFLALADIRDSGKMLHNPALQAAAGLLSGSLSAYTKWPGVKK